MTSQRIIILATLLIVSTSLQAQRFNQKSINDDLRHNQWEAALMVVSGGGLDLSGDRGSSLDIDDAVGWGFSIGYNLSANWNFAYRMTLQKPDYTIVIVPEVDEGEDPVPREIQHEADHYAHQINATWHWFDGPLTPYLQAGIGYGKLDSNIPSQPPTTGCWWDPWWGYICDTQWKTHESSEFTYNLGIGVRWDVNGALFVRGAYNREWFGADAGDLEFDTLNLDIGLMW